MWMPELFSLCLTPRYNTQIQCILMQNLNDHLADPAGVNAFNYATKFT
jgi:hypothetical protein